MDMAGGRLLNTLRPSKAQTVRMAQMVWKPGSIRDWDYEAFLWI